MDIKYNPELNYCTYSPDVVLGVKINYACFLHDRHYRNEVLHRYTRKQADLLLKECIHRYLKNSNVAFEFRLRLKWKRIGLNIDLTIINKNWAISKTKLMIGFRKRLARPVSWAYYVGAHYLGYFTWKK